MIKFTKKSDNFYDLDKLYWLTGLQGAKNDFQKYKTTVLIESGVGVTSDGSRLYAACLESAIPNGVYEIIKRTKSEIILAKNDMDSDQWPNWEVIFDSITVNGTIESNFNVWNETSFPGKTTGAIYLGLSELKDKMPLINSNYIEAAVTGFCDHIEIICKDDLSPLFMVDSNDPVCINRAAAIMPIHK